MAFEAKRGKGRHRSYTTENAVSDVTQEELKGFHVQIPLSLHTSFKSKAAGNGEKMKDIVNKLIREYIEKY